MKRMKDKNSYKFVLIAALLILILAQVTAAVNYKPNIPTLYAPSDGAVIETLLPTFTWSPFSDPDANDTQSAFQIRILEAPGPNSFKTDTVLDKEYSGNASLVTPSPADYIRGLVNGKWYHWHVRVKDSYGVWSDWAADKENDASLYMDFRITPNPLAVTPIPPSPSTPTLTSTVTSTSTVTPAPVLSVDSDPPVNSGISDTPKFNLFSIIGGILMIFGYISIPRKDSIIHLIVQLDFKRITYKGCTKAFVGIILIILGAYIMVKSFGMI